MLRHCAVLKSPTHGDLRGLQVEVQHRLPRSDRPLSLVLLGRHQPRNKVLQIARKEMFYLTTHSTHFIYGYMEGRKEMFYLTMHSTHFIYGYMEGRKEMFYLMMHSAHFIYGYMEGRKEMFYLTMHSTHFIYGYIASCIW